METAKAAPNHVYEAFLDPVKMGLAVSRFATKSLFLQFQLFAATWAGARNG